MIFNTEEILLTNSQSWVTIHGLHNFHSLCEKELLNEACCTLMPSCA